MNKSKQEANRAHWLEHVSTWSKSGLTQSAYCRQHGINAALLSAWVVRVRKGSEELAHPGATLVPLMVESDDVKCTANQVAIVVEHKSGWQLHLSHDTQAIWLGDLLSRLV